MFCLLSRSHSPSSIGAPRETYHPTRNLSAKSFLSSSSLQPRIQIHKDPLLQRGQILQNNAILNTTINHLLSRNYLLSSNPYTSYNNNNAVAGKRISIITIPKAKGLSLYRYKSTNTEDNERSSTIIIENGNGSGSGDKAVGKVIMVEDIPNSPKPPFPSFLSNCSSHLFLLLLLFF